jgi:hypothetical protein
VCVCSDCDRFNFNNRSYTSNFSSSMKLLVIVKELDRKDTVDVVSFGLVRFGFHSVPYVISRNDTP